MAKKKYSEIALATPVYTLSQKSTQDMVQNCRLVISGPTAQARAHAIFTFVADKKLQYFIANMKARNRSRLKQVIKIREVCAYIKIKKYFSSIFPEMISNARRSIHRNRLERQSALQRLRERILIWQGSFRLLSNTTRAMMLITRAGRDTNSWKISLLSITYRTILLLFFQAVRRLNEGTGYSIHYPAARYVNELKSQKRNGFDNIYSQKIKKCYTMQKDEQRVLVKDKGSTHPLIYICCVCSKAGRLISRFIEKSLLSCECHQQLRKAPFITSDSDESSNIVQISCFSVKVSSRVPN